MVPLRASSTTLNTHTLGRCLAPYRSRTRTSRVSVHPVELVAVGAGGRGFRAYGRYALAHPEEVRYVAVAEPNEERRYRFAAAHGIPAARQFQSWEELTTRPQLAQGAVNTTMDR